MKTVRIGCGAGYAGDRLEPAIELAEKGRLHYLVFECLSERTISLAQLVRSKNPDAGFDPLLEERMRAVLPICQKNGTKIISNMGAANPKAAARNILSIARSLGLNGLKVACVTGDDVLDLIRAGQYIDKNGCALIPLHSVISANAYLGAEPIIEALKLGADVIITGRTADPSLFLAPLMHEFSWRSDDWPMLGQGTLVGHLLECAGQLTGGYFADPGYKDVPRLAHLGFPLAEVSADGCATITKVEGSGGMISRATCTEQLLYEVQDPAAYITPDVIADFSDVKIEELGCNSVLVSHASGRERPGEFKVSVGYKNGFVGEGQISYAGPGAVERAMLAKEIVEERLRSAGFEDLESSLIGINSIFGDALSPKLTDVHEVRLRVVGRSHSSSNAQRIPREVETLYTNGPAGGGGVTGTTREMIAVEGMLLPRHLVQHRVSLESTE